MTRITARFALLFALIVPAFAQASSFAGSSAGSASAGSAGSSDSSENSSNRNNKLVLQARDDAAGFVASAGRIRGAQLEAALRVLRERNPQARQASDLQLAQAILALRRHGAAARSGWSWRRWPAWFRRMRYNCNAMTMG